MAKGERYEKAAGAAGSQFPSIWLTSGDFPNYNVEVQVSIVDIQKGYNLDVGGGTRRDGLVAIFEKRQGRPEKRLLLGQTHQKMLRKVFQSNSVESWRGPINVFCREDAWRVGGEVKDGVMISALRPSTRSPAGASLNDEPNVGGGPGSLGEPYRHAPVTATDVNRTFSEPTVPLGTLEPEIDPETGEVIPPHIGEGMESSSS